MAYLFPFSADSAFGSFFFLGDFPLGVFGVFASLGGFGSFGGLGSLGVLGSFGFLGFLKHNQKSEF